MITTAIFFALIHLISFIVGFVTKNKQITNNVIYRYENRKDGFVTINSTSDILFKEKFPITIKVPEKAFD